MEEADPTAPARLGTLQEPTERTEDTRERPPAGLHRPLADPEEKTGEQTWVAMILAEAGYNLARSLGSRLSRPLWSIYTHSLWGVGMLVLGKPVPLPES